MKTQVLSLFLIAGAYIVLPPTVHADDPAAAEGARLLSRALEMENIRADGSQPFLLRAALTVEISKKQFRGTYILAWESKSRWREETKITDFERTLVGANGGTWKLRSYDYLPRVILDLDALVSMRSVVPSAGPEIKKRKYLKKIGNRNAECFKGAGVEFCFDRLTGLLVHWEAAVSSVASSSEYVEVDYSNFSPWGEKQFPFHLRSERQKSIVVDLSVTELQPLPADYNGFAPPENAEFWPTCEQSGSQSRRLQRRVQPEYPRAAQLMGKGGVVTLYAIIEGDGSPSHLKVIVSAGSALDQAALEAVRQWRYEPLVCDGKAIRVETTIDVLFALGR